MIRPPPWLVTVGKAVTAATILTVSGTGPGATIWNKSPGCR